MPAPASTGDRANDVLWLDAVEFTKRLAESGVVGEWVKGRSDALFSTHVFTPFARSCGWKGLDLRYSPEKELNRHDIGFESHVSIRCYGRFAHQISLPAAGSAGPRLNFAYLGIHLSDALHNVFPHNGYELRAA
jgi:hypothetical protein